LRRTPARAHLAAVFVDSRTAFAADFFFYFLFSQLVCKCTGVYEFQIEKVKSLKATSRPAAPFAGRWTVCGYLHEF
jgi:hypothetical protein